MRASIKQINELQDELEAAKQTYLTERGWLNSSDYPDSRWRWSNSEYVGLTTDSAISIQSHLDDGYKRKSPRS